MDEVTLTRGELAELRIDGEMEPNTIYIVEADRDSAESYAVSPDGIGMYWYDTQELLEADFIVMH